MLDYICGDLELKSVSISQRTITGWAAHHHSIDRVRDIIDPAASEKAVKRLKSPSDVGVFIAHSPTLPVGIPQKIEATPQGLYTETYILRGPAGDNLLAVAKDLMDHGLSLGMSIGYKTHDSKMERTAHGRVRRLLDLSLLEYSFAPAQAIANPSALVTAVKSRRRVHREQLEAKMQYRVERVIEGEQERWLVYRDADADGDEDDNRLIGTYSSQETANAVATALRLQARLVDGDEVDEAGMSVGAADKTLGEPPEGDISVKATWSAAKVNDFEDSCFLYVEDGEKDDQNKTVPRSKRHFPYRTSPDAPPDLDHLRNAIARIPQSDLPSDLKARLQARARRLLAQATSGDGKTVDEPPEWQSGAPLALYGLGAQLQDIADQLAGELKAMDLLSEETKDYRRIREPLRAQIAQVEHQLYKLREFAETCERGEDGQQRLAWLRQQLALTEI